MRIEKKHLDEMYRCYCASSIYMDDEQHILLASEEKGGPCYDYSGKNFDKKEVVWDNAGGTMSIIPIPGRNGEFLAVQEFYLKVSPSLAKIVWGKHTEDGWQIRDVLHLPYIHRFDLYEKNGVIYFIGATIATTKENKEDWSVPGRIYVGELGDDPSAGIDIEILADGMYRNHGYWHGKENGEDVGYFSSDQGIVKVTPPEKKGGEWKLEKVMEGAIGEVAVIDIDQDGEEELMTIEPFHGTEIKIYKKINGTYQEVWHYDNKIDFAHTLVGANLCGVPTFLAGIRREDAEIFYVQYVNGKYETTIIEQGAGPANLAVVHENDRDLIVAANHTKNEAAVYFVYQ